MKLYSKLTVRGNPTRRKDFDRVSEFANRVKMDALIQEGPFLSTAFLIPVQESGKPGRLWILNGNPPVGAIPVEV